MRHVDPAVLLKHAESDPPLAAPAGTVVRVRTTEGLVDAIAGAEPHTTILVADGTYELPLGVSLETDNVVLRSESGDRTAVVLDGAKNHMTVNSALLRIRRASRVTIADVTFANAKKYGVLVYGDSNVQNLTVYNVVFRNCWCRGLKGTDPSRPDDRRTNPRNPDDVADRVRPHGGQVRYCLFTADHTKTDRDDGFDGDYISGIDMVRLSDWVFADNIFCNLRGANGGGRGAIFIWVGSDTILIERDLFVACDRSIALGNPSNKRLSVKSAVVRDNRIVAGVNRAIECNSTSEVNVYDNRIFATHDTFPTVEFIDGSAGGLLHHNIIHGRISCEPDVVVEHNHIGLFGGLFIDPANGDLGFTEKGALRFGDWKWGVK